VIQQSQKKKQRGKKPVTAKPHILLADPFIKTLGTLYKRKVKALKLHE